MIKFEKTDVMNFEGAIRGMRNPLNSWDKSDSFDCNKCVNKIIKPEECPMFEDFILCNKIYYKGCFCIGPNDMKLAQNLIKAGSDHRKFLRQIFVSVDITAPLYWWKEFDTYKVGTVANSCSTMHKIHTKPLILDDFSHEHLELESIKHLEALLDWINCCRKEFIRENKKDEWWQIIQLLPSSYNQKRTVTFNYEVLRNIRHSDRRNHKLDEWRIGFMEWIDSLPYAEKLLTI